MLTLLQICVSLALVVLVSAQERYCFNQRTFPFPYDGLFPALFCSETTLTYVSKTGEHVILRDPENVYCTKALHASGQLDIKDPTWRQGLVRAGIVMLIQDYCLLREEKEKISQTIVELASKKPAVIPTKNAQKSEI